MNTGKKLKKDVKFGRKLKRIRDYEARPSVIRRPRPISVRSGSSRPSSWIKGNRVSAVGDTRSLAVGVTDPSVPAIKFISNKIVTSKYTVWNFLPKNMFEQFRRIANFYFLCMTVISLSIDSPVSPWTSITPLVFVIFVTALKQGYEDWLRHRADKEVNCAPVTVVRNGIAQEVEAQDIVVGDIVRVMRDSDMPCDIVLLSSSEPDRKCYVTTANLDGETNLKILQCPRLLQDFSIPEQISTLRAQIECEQPTSDLYSFFGRLEIFVDKPKKNNKLSLTGTIRRRWNTFRNSFSAPKATRSRNTIAIDQMNIPPDVVVLEHRRALSDGCYQDPNKINNNIRNSSINYIMNGGGVSNRASDIPEEDVQLRRNSDTVTSDGLHRFRPSSNRTANSSNIDNNFVRNSARTSNVSNFSNLSNGSILSNENNHKLENQDLSAPLRTDNLLLRGSRLKNTEFVYGCAVYTGQETKLALNSRLTSNKFSTVEKSINGFLLFFMVLLLVEVGLCLGLKYYTEFQSWFISSYYLGPKPEMTAGNVVQDLLSFFILYNYIIPISLYVTIELQKFLGTLFFEWDSELFCMQSGQPAICNTSDLNEELGQVEYLFTDKTGTLTENNMCFRRFSLNGEPYIERDGIISLVLPSGDENTGTKIEALSAELEQFLLVLALCHTVQVTGNNKLYLCNNNVPECETEQEMLDYQASSPDEKALVEAAARCGVVFLGEEGDLMYVRIKGVLKQYNRLDTLEFTSDRKRMSVIIRDEEGQIWLYCKGAESTVIPLTGSGPVNQTLGHIGEFAMRGLRTMVIGCKKFTQKEYDSLSGKMNKARQLLTNRRDSMVASSYNKMEDGLKLLGATGVEDKLQDGVQETLESLKAAGIKVWILTGDKIETAVNISFSCGHFKAGTEQLFLTEHTSEDACVSMLQAHRAQVARERYKQYGLVVDGMSLKYSLRHGDLFREVCMACTAVICCRMSPIQKCEVVQLVKTSSQKPITAAIGDGANDVSMIQEAHVGLGIMGKEGRQAVRCSDFAFGQFRFVRRVLLVHGHWYYLRVSTLVLYFFYKNIVFIAPQLFFSIFNAFSTQALYDSAYLTLYNVLFTSLPILIYGLFEQNYTDETLLGYPHLYQNIANNILMSWSSFFKWILFGVWHAALVYFFPHLFLDTNDTLLYDNTQVDLWMLGTITYHCVIVVANLKLLLHSRYWTFIYMGSICLSVFGFIALCSIYTLIPGAMYWVYFKLLASPSFWLLTVIVVIAALMPDTFFLVLEPYFNDLIRKIKKRNTRLLETHL